MTAILGISAFYHDSAAALIVGGVVVAAAQEERFTRKKHDFAFPRHAIEYCLEEGRLSPGEVDYVGFYDKPFRKFERLLETYLAFAPAGFRSFASAMPLWLRQKLHLPREMRRGLKGQYRKRFVFAEHHEPHAASAFFPSPFDEAAILTLDGVGEWATASYGVGRGNRIKLTHELRFPHSLGLLCSAFTYFCGFKVNSGEYKLMGLAPYGDPKYEDVREGPFERIWIQPAAGDAGGALGVAWLIWHQLLGNPRRPSKHDSQQGSLLGKRFSAEEVRARLDALGAAYRHYPDEERLCDRVADLLAAEKVVGWMEFGPRALGCRSILGDARSRDMQKTMNLKIKFRESFRPFAPAVLCDRAGQYFQMRDGEESPYMLLVAPLADSPRSGGDSPAASPLGLVLSWLLLAAVYYLVLTPIGVLRAIGHDPLNRSRDVRTGSYWVAKKEDEGRGSYFRQF